MQMNATLIGYVRCLTDKQDLTANFPNLDIGYDLSDRLCPPLVYCPSSLIFFTGPRAR